MILLFSPTEKTPLRAFELSFIVELYEYVSDRYMSILIERDLTLSLADALKNLVGSCRDSLDKVITYPIKVRLALYFFRKKKKIKRLLFIIFKTVPCPCYSDSRCHIRHQPGVIRSFCGAGHGVHVSINSRSSKTNHSSPKIWLKKLCTKAN